MTRTIPKRLFAMSNDQLSIDRTGQTDMELGPSEAGTTAPAREAASSPRSAPTAALLASPVTRGTTPSAMATTACRLPWELSQRPVRLFRQPLFRPI